MEEAKKIVVDIVAWNSLAYLQNLFATLQEQDTTDFTVSVVDNASDDGTSRWMMAHQPAVTMLRNFRNQGFARAHNQAISLALTRWPEESWSQRYILVVNPDIEFSPSCLRVLAEAMDAHPDVAVCGPKLLRAFVKSQDEGRMETEHTSVIDSTGLIIKKSRRSFDRGAGEADRGQYDDKVDVFGISGACVMFRASALAEAKLGGEFFDEDFFAYKEDVDLAWRMRKLGMKAMFVPQAIAWHHRTAPSIQKGGAIGAWKLRRKKSPTINRLSTRNHHWMMWKNDASGDVLMHAIWIVPYEAAKACASIFSLPVLRGNLAALAGIGKMWKKRRELGRRTKLKGKAMRAWFV